MPISVTCKSCNNTYSVDEQHAGTTAPCPGCAQEIQVPYSASSFAFDKPRPSKKKVSFANLSQTDTTAESSGSDQRLVRVSNEMLKELRDIGTAARIIIAYFHVSAILFFLAFLWFFAAYIFDIDGLKLNIF